ncbi:hypothetical protein [Echinimonas agarilytica]|uniref:Uncharacterized protein n=1 Tax=Echinimonas agarilytica TaxID=1215918 RepID=A0AA41W8S9_9GAMM|nr:hypothetical protein [Echinimonas agarilytica]MCM2680688.1 hypothetical protein [Echinimonas agarilytica]
MVLTATLSQAQRIFVVIAKVLVSVFILNNAHASAKTASQLSYKDGFIHTSEHSDCVDCHSSEVMRWHQSDHYQSMALPSSETVIGNFNSKAQHHDHEAYFWTDDGGYIISFIENGKRSTYSVDYVFGYWPLQQYLTLTGGGHYQVIPFAWDDRAENDGGQRWFHMYPNESIEPDNRLHWLMPLQNWNGMCADCHSDRLVRNYDIDSNRFDSRWENINVGCLSCHGDMTAQNQERISHVLQQQNAGYWRFSEGDTTAHWEGEKRDNSAIENCYFCHSLRAPLTDGFEANQGFLNTFQPMLLQSPQYYPNGHIRDEVYVWGSFQQSKMFEAGVNCLDCHDSHSYEIKLPGDGVCLQCHSYDAYGTEKHHHHDAQSDGSKCVDCHMPNSTFMVVDDRRDHSFSVPRPNNSLHFGTPNACTKCHQDKTDEWAAEWSSKWYGKQIQSPSEINFMRLQSGEDIGLKAALLMITDEQLPPIKRASALRLTPHVVAERLNSTQLQPLVASNEPLIRIAAAEASKTIEPLLRSVLVQDLLSDELKAVRVVAADALIDVPVSEAYLVSFNQAFKELVYANQLSAWRGEGWLNQGLLHTRKGELIEAEQSYLSAIEVDPYFPVSYINLTDIYRATLQPSKAQKLYERAITYLPQDSTIRYSFGLHLIRQGQPEKAAEQFELSVKYQLDSEQYIFTWVLTLNALGQLNRGLQVLQLHQQRIPLSPRLVQLGMRMAQQAGNLEAHQWLLK